MCYYYCFLCATSFIRLFDYKTNRWTNGLKQGIPTTSLVTGCNTNKLSALLLLEGKGDGWTVANLSRTPVLDRTRIYEACLLRPLVALRDEELEWLAIEFNESLADYRLHLA